MITKNLGVEGVYKVVRLTERADVCGDPLRGVEYCSFDGWVIVALYQEHEYIRPEHGNDAPREITVTFAVLRLDKENAIEKLSQEKQGLYFQINELKDKLSSLSQETRSLHKELATDNEQIETLNRELGHSNHTEQETIERADQTLTRLNAAEATLGRIRRAIGKLNYNDIMKEKPSAQNNPR